MADPLHIAYLTPSWPPGVGRPNGIATAVGQTVPAMRERGHEVSVLSRQVHGPESEEVLALHRPDRPFLGALRQYVLPDGARMALRQHNIAVDVANGFRRLAERRPLDLIEVEESFGLGRLIAQRLGVPVITRLHGPWRVGREALGVPLSAADTQRIEAEERAVAEAAGLSAPSRAALSAFPPREGPTAVLPNPMVLPEAAWVPEGAVPGRVAFIGRIDTPKGADTAILAAARLMEAGRPLELVLCGPDYGIEEDGETLRFADFLAKHVPEGLHGRFDYRGTLTAEEVSALRAESAGILVTSRFENFPYSVAEAMAAGCPLVAAASGGIKEMVEDGRTGLLVPAGDAAATAAALDRAVFGGEGPALGAAAREWAAATLDPGRLAERTEAFYREVIAAAPSSSRHPRRA